VGGRRLSWDGETTRKKFLKKVVKTKSQGGKEWEHDSPREKSWERLIAENAKFSKIINGRTC